MLTYKIKNIFKGAIPSTKSLLNYYKLFGTSVASCYCVLLKPRDRITRGRF